MVTMVIFSKQILHNVPPFICIAGLGERFAEILTCQLLFKML